MSSNIRVQKTCQQCGNEFTAKTTVTKYCSDRCSKAAYKARKRNEKINKTNQETRQHKTQSSIALKEKAFLSVTEASQLIGCSRRNIYKLIKSGKLKATNILLKKTIIRRHDLDKLFTEPESQDPIPVTQKNDLELWKQYGEFEITDCYTISEIQTKYSISEKTLYELIKRNSLPKIKKGWYVYVPKVFIDGIMNQSTINQNRD